MKFSSVVFIQFLGIKFVPGKITEFFRALILDTIATREREGIIRPDLLQLLIQAKKGTLHDENSAQSHKNTKTSKEVFTLRKKI
jgi:cytochrome P450 family 9